MRVKIGCPGCSLAFTKLNLQAETFTSALPMNPATHREMGKPCYERLCVRKQDACCCCLASSCYHGLNCTVHTLHEKCELHNRSISIHIHRNIPTIGLI